VCSAARGGQSALYHRLRDFRLDDICIVGILDAVIAAIIDAVGFDYICLGGDEAQFAPHKLLADTLQVAIANIAVPLAFRYVYDDLLNGQVLGQLFLCALWLPGVPLDGDRLLLFLGINLRLVEQRVLLKAVIKDILGHFA
jgi:hypothetical protein